MVELDFPIQVAAAAAADTFTTNFGLKAATVDLES
jgi:hypothetical protein